MRISLVVSFLLLAVKAQAFNYDPMKDPQIGHLLKGPTDPLAVRAWAIKKISSEGGIVQPAFKAAFDRELQARRAEYNGNLRNGNAPMGKKSPLAPGTRMLGVPRPMKKKAPIALLMSKKILSIQKKGSIPRSRPTVKKASTLALTKKSQRASRNPRSPIASQAAPPMPRKDRDFVLLTGPTPPDQVPDIFVDFPMPPILQAEVSVLPAGTVKARPSRTASVRAASVHESQEADEEDAEEQDEEEEASQAEPIEE